MLLLTLIWACTTPAPTTPSPSATGNTGHTSDTAAPIEAPLVISPGVTWEAPRLGSAICLAGDSLALSLPGHTGHDSTAIIKLIDALSHSDRVEGGVTLSTDQIVGTNLGEVMACVGDVSGSGAPTVVAFDEPGALPQDAYLFSGPFVESQYAESDALPIPWADARSAGECGDLDADGTDDLCLNIGIAFGPVADPVAADVTWSAASDPGEIRVAGADLDADGQRELIVTEPDTSEVHRITGFPTGDHDLSAIAASTWTAPTKPIVVLADGDLDGDGLDDLVVAWDTALAVATDLSGSDLSTAHATVSLTGAQAVAVGDVDGDGADDLVVGTQGEVRIYLGPLAAGTLTATDADKLLVGQQHPDDDFGHALLASDIDGDGDDELFVGAPQHTEDTLEEGRVYRYMNPMLAP